MIYKVDGWNNFCRVFELPEEFSGEYCFGGGIPTNFQMVDWFYPVQGLEQPGVSKEVWREKVGEFTIAETTEDELRETLVPFLLNKRYVKPGRTYLILCAFGASITFKGAE